MEIRKIVVNSDIEKIKAIYEKTFEIREGILSNYYYGFSNYIDFCVKQNYAYIAILDGCECGYILAYQKPDMMLGVELYIELLVVLPEYQRKGIGRKLLDKLKKQAKEEGIKEMALRTGCYMDAYEIYKKYGFQDTRDDQRFMIMNII